MMEELKFVWLQGMDNLEEEDYNVTMNYLKSLRKLKMINFNEDDPYFLAIKENQINEIRKLVEEKNSNIRLDLAEDIKNFFSTYFEQCGIELESSLNKRWNIDITTEHVLYKLKDEKQIYFNEETQDKILTGDFKKELYNLAEKMYKDELNFILNDLQTELKLAKYGK